MDIVIEQIANTPTPFYHDNSVSLCCRRHSCLNTAADLRSCATSARHDHAALFRKRGYISTSIASMHPRTRHA